MEFKQQEIIDATPSWAGNAKMLCVVFEQSTNKSWARSEIIRMGEIIDTLKAELESKQGETDG